MDDAIRILDRQSRVINPLSVLETLPNDLAVASIAPYLRRIFQKLGHKQQVGLVAKHAAQSESRAVELRRFQLQQRFVYVDDERTCCVCHKLISSDIFAVFPNLKLVHFRCFKEKSLDPERQVPFIAL